MKDHWILDVLTDLRSFATANGLTALSEQLEDARLVAAVELSQNDGTAVAVLGQDENTAGAALEAGREGRTA